MVCEVDIAQGIICNNHNKTGWLPKRQSCSWYQYVLSGQFFLSGDKIAIFIYRVHFVHQLLNESNYLKFCQGLQIVSWKQ
jgi:hypothetical protein